MSKVRNFFSQQVTSRLSRAIRGYNYYKPKMKLLWDWIINTRSEFSNFSYDLSPLNRQILVEFLHTLTLCKREEIEGYLSEILSDQSLISKMQSELEKRKLPYQQSGKFGRRVGWYILIRILKPNRVIETGVHFGIGGSIICRALERNKREGFEGHYIGTELNKNHGFLVETLFPNIGQILYGDSIKNIESIRTPVDIFINDSDHSPEYEMQEYLSSKNIFTSETLILGDNSHVSNSLINYSRLNQRLFVFFKEEPSDHWYLGAGIGLSFSKVPVVPYQ